MENKDNAVFLKHILECIEKIESYVKGMNFESFRHDAKTTDAVVRNVEVIGEAANNLTREFRSKHAQIEWRKIIDTRNRIIHGYATVDLEIIWNITQNDVSLLKTEIEKILEDLS